MRFPVPAFLVEHPGAGLMLVDTGFHPSVVVNQSEAFGRIAGILFKDLEMTPEQAVPGQMRDLGPRSRRGAHRGDDPPPLRPRERHLAVPRRDLRRQRRRVAGGGVRGADAGLPTPPVRPRLRLPADRLRQRRGRLVRHLRPGSRPVRRRQRPAGLHSRPHQGAPVGDPQAGRPGAPAHRRRRLHDAHDRRDRAALPDGGRALLHPLAAGDPALRRAYAHRGDHPGARHPAWEELEEVYT